MVYVLSKRSELLFQAAPIFKYTIMKHSLPNDVRLLLKEWEYLGFNNLRESADFVLANAEWNILVRGIEFKENHLAVVAAWRDVMLGHEVRRGVQTVVPTCSSIDLFSSPSFGGKVSKTGFDD